MATIKRRKRQQRNATGLTSNQRVELLYGFSFAGEPSFADENAMRAAWHRYRSALMNELGPGRRPEAFYAFDLQFARMPLHWSDEIAVLREHDLIDATEALLIEKAHSILSTHPGETGFSSTDELSLAADWHAWRGRPELANRYAARAANARRAMEAAK